MLPTLRSDPSSSSTRLRVLIVEDEALLRWAISESLAAAGHTVMAVSDAASAMQVVDGEAQPPDAILLDYRLPDSHGLELLRELRVRAASSAIVLMTACNTPELTDLALALGAYRVVDKPFEMAAIEACLRAAAGHG